MKIKVVGSSSDGNCYIVNDELILDAGMPFKDIQKACGFKLGDKKCLVTHEHGDHSKAVERLAEYSTSIYMSKGTKEALGANRHNITAIEPMKQIKILNYIVLPFQTEHDAAEPLGFLIQDTRTGEKLLFATDTYFIRYKFQNVDYFLLECNYSEKIVHERIENNEINSMLAKRLLTSHFSLENVIEFLKGLDLRKTSKIMLIHLSDSNSDEKMFCRRIESETSVETIALNKGDLIDLWTF